MPVWRIILRLILPVLLLTAGPGWSLDLTVPGKAELTREVETPAGTYFVPTGPYADGRLPSKKVEGRIIRQAWRIEGDDLTTLKLLMPLREQLVAAGYEILLDCEARECGGFDFRFATSVMPAPAMFVDLFDFRFLSAHKENGDGADYVTALVSVVGSAGYLQLVIVGTGDIPRIESSPDQTARPAPGTDASAKGALIETLLEQGHVILSDLEFATGSAALEDRDYASLAELAAFLKADPRRRIALVGHTDAVGALDKNIALSRLRATAVMERLAERYGVPREQMEANGMGYLAPVAPNTTPRGREANRRVEAVLLNTE